MMRIRKSILWILTLSIAGIIFFFSSQSVEASSQLSSGVTGGFLSVLQFLHITPEQYVGMEGIIRSAAHVIVFMALGFSAALLMRCYTQRFIGWVFTMVCCAAYALFDECVQLWFARGRAFEWADILKDCSGVLLGICFVAVLCFCVSKVRQKRGN